jgi:hypothetical protein
MCVCWWFLLATCHAGYMPCWLHAMLATCHAGYMPCWLHAMLATCHAACAVVHWFCRNSRFLGTAYMLTMSYPLYAICCRAPHQQVLVLSLSAQLTRCESVAARLAAVWHAICAAFCSRYTAAYPSLCAANPMQGSPGRPCAPPSAMCMLVCAHPNNMQQEHRRIVQTLFAAHCCCCLHAVVPPGHYRTTTATGEYTVSKCSTGDLQQGLPGSYQASWLEPSDEAALNCKSCGSGILSADVEPLMTYSADDDNYGAPIIINVPGSTESCCKCHLQQLSLLC